MTTVDAERPGDPGHSRVAFLNKFIFDLVREHLGLFLSLMTVLAITARIIWVAHGDAVTVTAIVTHQGAGGLVVTVFAVGLPIVAGLAAVLTASDMGEAIREEMPWKVPAATLAAFFALSLLSVPSEWMRLVTVFVASIAIYSILARVIRYACLKNDRKIPFLFSKTDGYQKRSSALLLIVTLFAVTPALTFTDSMWLPKERISHAGREDVGYVISGDGDFTHVVLDHDRSSVIIKTESITERDYCPQPSKGRPVLTEWFWPAPKEYKC